MNLLPIIYSSFVVFLVIFIGVLTVSYASFKIRNRKNQNEIEQDKVLYNNQKPRSLSNKKVILSEKPAVKKTGGNSRSAVTDKVNTENVVVQNSGNRKKLRKKKDDRTHSKYISKKKTVRWEKVTDLIRHNTDGKTEREIGSINKRLFLIPDIDKEILRYYEND